MRGTTADITHTQYAGGVGSYNNRLHFLSPISTLFAQEIPLTFGMEVKQILEFTRPGFVIVHSGHNVLDFPDKLTSGDLPKYRWQNLTSLLKTLMQV